jgi:hypothetical protein
VTYANETFVGEAVDYDFGRDVGLLRIKPGRRLAHARVVPAHWKPQARMRMITVGCSEGNDATAWNTDIVNPSFHGLAGRDVYEAIECKVAPKQGRSGGGLFTSDGYVAGVCDFAEPRGNHGLYASPRSIYHLLDRNQLMALYAPARDPGRLLADNRETPRSAVPPKPGLIARGQSPSRDDPVGGAGAVSLPPPEMLGIKPPVLVNGNDQPAPTRRGAWQRPAHPDQARTVDLKMDPALDPDKFGPAEPTVGVDPPASEPHGATTNDGAPPTPTLRMAPGKWRAGREPLPELTSIGGH